uniref:Uncharacterized protein n=1 Tax=Rhizophora mucronata TaxID=61149 RepID=A0A2P2QHU8_RHIMU
MKKRKPRSRKAKANLLNA